MRPLCFLALLSVVGCIFLWLSLRHNDNNEMPPLPPLLRSLRALSPHCRTPTGLYIMIRSPGAQQDRNVPGCTKTYQCCKMLAVNVAPRPRGTSWRPLFHFRTSGRSIRPSLTAANAFAADKGPVLQEPYSQTLEARNDHTFTWS